MPGDEIELKSSEKIPNGRYGVEPFVNARRISQPTEWLQPSVLQIQNENSPFLLKISGVKFHDGFDGDNYTQIALAFDQTVTVTESFYPKLSMTKIISDLGGSLGFWLGLGAVQLCLNVFNYLPRLMKCKK